MSVRAAYAGLRPGHAIRKQFSADLITSARDVACGRAREILAELIFEDDEMNPLAMTANVKVVIQIFKFADVGRSNFSQTRTDFF